MSLNCHSYKFLCDCMLSKKIQSNLITNDTKTIKKTVEPNRGHSMTKLFQITSLKIKTRLK